MSLPALVNLALLIAYPVAWMAPLAHAGYLPFFQGSEITVLGAVRDLWASDPWLGALVAALAVAVPYAKTLLVAALHRGWLGPRALPALSLLGKLSMTDVFLVAIYIVVVKGVGLGHVTPAWGLWLFTGCVLASIWATRARG